MDITQPMIHDRHVVKNVFEYMKVNEINKGAFKKPTSTQTGKIPADPNSIY